MTHVCGGRQLVAMQGHALSPMLSRMRPLSTPSESSFISTCRCGIDGTHFLNTQNVDTLIRIAVRLLCVCRARCREKARSDLQTAPRSSQANPMCE